MYMKNQILRWFTHRSYQKTDNKNVIKLNMIVLTKNKKSRHYLSTFDIINTLELFKNREKPLISQRPNIEISGFDKFLNKYVYIIYKYSHFIQVFLYLF